MSWIVKVDDEYVIANKVDGQYSLSTDHPGNLVKDMYFTDEIKRNRIAAALTLAGITHVDYHHHSYFRVFLGPNGGPAQPISIQTALRVIAAAGLELHEVNV